MKKKLTIIARAVISLLILAAIGWIIWWDFAGQGALISGAQSPQTQLVEIPDSQTTLACPSAPALASLGDSFDESPGTYDPEYAPDTGDATSVISVLSASTSQQRPASSLLTPVVSLQSNGSHESDEPSSIEGSGAVLNDTIQTQGAAGYTASAASDGEGAPLVAGIRYGSATYGDLRGIAATNCVPTAADQWLVGGQTEAGSSAELELINPFDTPSSVLLELWGAAGPIELVGGSEILVPAQESRSILLEGLAPQERRLAVRVQSSGARIGAVMQDVRTVGLASGGVDYVTQAAPPAELVTIPGIEIKDGDIAALRLLAPGPDPGSVTVRLVGSGGEVSLPDLRDQQISGEAVSEMSLAGIQAGTYTAVVESTVPIVGSALLATGPETQERDIAWMPGVSLATRALFALPPKAVNATALETSFALVLAGGPQDAAVRVRALSSGGEMVDLEQLIVGSGRSREIGVSNHLRRLQSADNSAFSRGEDIIGIVIESDEPIAAGITLRAGSLLPEGIAMLPATSDSISPSQVAVRYIP